MNNSDNDSFCQICFMRANHTTREHQLQITKRLEHGKQCDNLSTKHERCTALVMRNGQGYICGRWKGHYGNHRMSVVWNDKNCWQGYDGKDSQTKEKEGS